VKLLSLARDLKRRKARERRALFVAEGVRTTEELLASPLALHGALVSSALTEAPRGELLLAALARRGVPIESVGDADFASAADTEAPQGVLAIAGIPERALDGLLPLPRGPLLLLDALQDPGNVGTILRTAAAFGAPAALALPGTVDLWNAKVVRSAMGSLFHFPALSCTWDEFDAFRARSPRVVWGADARGDVLDPRADRPDALALVVGNEGAGLSPAARGRADRLLALPITGRVESLNAAVAAGILLYELTR
jgi:TrmH family RNA methyltransferase